MRERPSRRFPCMQPARSLMIPLRGPRQRFQCFRMPLFHSPFSHPMVTLHCLFRVPAFVAGCSLFLSGTRAVRAVTVAEASVNEGGPGMTSLAIVDGRPAIAWVDTGARAIKYVRALDADGAA